MRAPRHHRAADATGFTLVEIMVVLAVLVLIFSMGLPALQSFVHRGKIEGAARSTAVMMRAARYESIKRSIPTVVRVGTTSRRAVAFVDDDGNGALDAGERQLGNLTLPSGVSFAAPPAQLAILGLTVDGDEGWASFNADGSVVSAGAIRIADSRENFLEVRVAPAATARVEVRKWDGAAWHASGEGGHPWEWR